MERLLGYAIAFYAGYWWANKTPEERKAILGNAYTAGKKIISTVPQTSSMQQTEQVSASSQLLPAASNNYVDDFISKARSTASSQIDKYIK